MREPGRAHWGILIGGAALVIAGGFALPHLVPPPALQENRTLAPPPARPASLADLTAFRKAADAYVADHFPARQHLIGALNALRMAFGVSGSPKVAVGRGGWLFSDDGTHLGAARGVRALPDAEAIRWLEGLAGRSEAMRAEGRGYVVLIAPVKETVYPDRAPCWFDLDVNRPAVTLTALARASAAGEVIYPQAVLAKQARWGLHVYDRYDSHWTGLGAYHAYVAFMRSLQRQGLAEGPRPLEDFAERPDSRTAPAPPPTDLALMLGVASFVKADHPQLEDPAAGRTLRVTYLSDNHDWTGPQLIETGRTGKPVLLITGDSFSRALIPLLYSHFSRIVVAHHEDGDWRRDLIDRFQPDIVALEVIESGAPLLLRAAPVASAEARARVLDVVTHRTRYAVIPRRTVTVGDGRRIEGGPGNDVIKGTRRGDDIQARGGDDTVSGLDGDDVIRGGRGRDVIDGGRGNDWISGGRDDDILKGGPGADVFNSFVDAGTDVVLDFNAAEGDRVEIDQGVGYTVRQAGRDLVIEMQGARLILKGVDLAGLPPGWIRNE